MNKWVTGTEPMWDGEAKRYVQLNPVTGQLLHIQGDYLYIVDMEGVIHQRYYKNCRILDRKPDEAGPYR